MAKRYKADSVLFQRLEHTTTMNDDEYYALSLFDKDGNMKEQYCAFFDDKIFEDSVINQQNNLLPKRRETAP